MDLNQIKHDVDLIAYARDHYSITVNRNGNGSCPFHPPDNNSSFSIFKGEDGCWRFHCFHDDISGTIVDLKARLEAIDEKEAIDLLLAEFRLAPMGKSKPDVLREHVYKDAEGKPIFKKLKYKPNSAGRTWALLHHENDAWLPGKGGLELVPYNLDRFKGRERVIVAEGEKDSDTINGLGLDLFATSAPTGCASWPDAITKYFAGFKELTFLYDIGNDEHVLKHATELHAAFPGLAIKIATVPGTQREFDITDYLGDEPDKATAMTEVLAQAKPYPFAAIEPRIRVAGPTGVLKIENVFLNDFVSSLAKFTDAPEIFLLFSGIALLSGVANKFYFHFPRKIYLNLYLLLLAPSTFCRKSTCTDIVSDYLREVDPCLLLPESFTPEAMFDILKAHPRGLIIWRELIQVKEFMFGSEYSKGLPAFLTDTYDYKKDFTRWTKGEGKICIENPIISILAAGIASWFVKNLNEIDFQGGIWTRFLFVPAPDQEHRYRLPRKFVLDPMIRGRLMHLNDRAPEEIDLSEITPLIETWGQRHMEQSMNLEHAILQSVFLRLEVMLLKLAALFQLAEDESTTIGESAFRDAEHVIEFIKRRLPPFFQEEIQFSPNAQAQAKIEKYLKTKGPAPKGAILRYTHVDTILADRILKQLADEGRIKREDVKPKDKRGGRPTTVYTLC